MLEGIDQVPWKDFEHAYGPATDLPELLRHLPDPDLKVRHQVLMALHNKIFHQGSRFSASAPVIPFLIELCGNPQIPERFDLLMLWGRLIVGYFNILERPIWGDGENFYFLGKIQNTKANDSYSRELNKIYLESMRGYDLVCQLLGDSEVKLRIGATWVLACLQTKAADSVPRLAKQLRAEPSGWARAGMAFALGELGAAEPLRQVATSDPLDAARCMATCELARLEPSPTLIEPLLHFVSHSIAHYERIPGAGGKSTGDAAFSISLLPSGIQQSAVPAICDRLDQARAFDTMPLVETLLSAAFIKRGTPVTELTDLQKIILVRMIKTEELWTIGNLMYTFKEYGLTQDRDACARLAGVKVNKDESLAALRIALSHSHIGFLEQARNGMLEALRLDPTVFQRAPEPAECWLLCAKAFAETDPDRAIKAFQRGCQFDPHLRSRIDPLWKLAELLESQGQ